MGYPKMPTKEQANAAAARLRQLLERDCDCKTITSNLKLDNTNSIC